jgi:hypothetical protein
MAIRALYADVSSWARRNQKLSVGHPDGVGGCAGDLEDLLRGLLPPAELVTEDVSAVKFFMLALRSLREP